MKASTTSAIGADAAMRVAAVAAAVTLVVLLTFVPVASNDLWLQAKIGQLILENWEIPRTVLFPYTWVRDNTFNAHEWLPSIAFHLLDRSLGHGGLLFAQGAFGLLQFGLCVLVARRLSGSLAIALLLGAMAMLVANYRYHLRPEIIALLLLMGLLHVLTMYRAGGDWRTLVWTVPIAIVWANSHGSFVLGPIVAAIFAAGEAAESARHAPGIVWRVRLHGAMRAATPYAAVACAMTVASLLNPLGIELLHFALTLSTSEVTKTFIDEWNATLSPRFMVRLPFAIFVGAVMLTLSVVFTCRRRFTVTDGLLLAAFALLALQRTRFIALFGFVALVVCARLIGAGQRHRNWERPLLAIAMGVGAIGIALTLLFGNVWGAFPFRSPSTDFTEPMVDRLSRQEMRGNVFNSYELGAELIYRTYPRLRPSMDSRIDSYGDRYFLLQEQLLGDEPLLKEFISDFDVRYMLLSWRDFNRIKGMTSLQKGWRMQFADHKAVLLERTETQQVLALPPGSPPLPLH